MKRLPIVEDWSCGQTGDCCRRVRSIRMTQQEAAAIRGATTQPLTWHEPEQGWVELQCHPCPLLDGNRCTVYAVRPYQCRRFQCHREAGEAFDPTGPLGCRNLSDRLEQSRATRRAYALNQRKAARWGLSHGWTGDET